VQIRAKRRRVDRGMLVFEDVEFRKTVYSGVARFSSPRFLNMVQGADMTVRFEMGFSLVHSRLWFLLLYSINIWVNLISLTFIFNIGHIKLVSTIQMAYSQTTCICLHLV
jgi:hypothetical protein